MKLIAILLSVFACLAHAQTEPEQGAAVPDKGAAAPAPAPVPNVPPTAVEFAPVGIAPAVDVSRYRCIDGKAYGDDCAASRRAYLGRKAEAQRSAYVLCVLDELQTRRGQSCAFYR